VQQSLQPSNALLKKFLKQMLASQINNVALMADICQSMELIDNVLIIALVLNMLCLQELSIHAQLAQIVLQFLKKINLDVNSVVAHKSQISHLISALKTKLIVLDSFNLMN